MSVPAITFLNTGDVVDADTLNDNLSSLSAAIQSVDNNNIPAQAGIDILKLSAQYEYMYVPIIYTQLDNTGLPAAATVLCSTPLYNDTKGTWTAVGYSWFCSDVGAMTGKFNIKWGYYANTGVINGSPTTIKSQETLDGGTANLPYQDGAAVSVSLPWTQNAMLLYADVDTQDATALDHTGGRLVVTVTLKRLIAT